jgi:hypothetical protein
MCLDIGSVSVSEFCFPQTCPIKTHEAKITQISNLFLMWDLSASRENCTYFLTKGRVVPCTLHTTAYPLSDVLYSCCIDKVFAYVRYVFSTVFAYRMFVEGAAVWTGKEGKNFCFTAQTPEHIRGDWSHCADTSEPVVGYGANTIVTVQCGFRTSNLKITSPMR